VLDSLDEAFPELLKLNVKASSSGSVRAFPLQTRVETNLHNSSYLPGKPWKTAQKVTVQSTRMSTWTFQKLVPQALHWSVCFQNI